MGGLETDRAKIVRRLLTEGWVSAGGTKHERFEMPDNPALVLYVPRHRTISPGVARAIAAVAGWRNDR